MIHEQSTNDLLMTHVNISVSPTFLNHFCKQVYQGESGVSVGGTFDTQTQAKMADHSEAMVAPASLTADRTLPLSAFNSSEISDVGPTPSTCTVSE